MVPESNSVDGIPLTNWIQGPERLPDIVKDFTDSRKGVVDKNVKSSFFLFLNFLKEALDFRVIRVVNLKSYAVAPSGTNLLCHLVQQG